MNIIPCATWVKRGVAAAQVEKVELTPTELEGIIKQTQSELLNLDAESDDEDDEPSTSTSKTKKKEESNNIEPTEPMEDDEFNFENYDDEAGDIQCHIGSLATINPDGKDPYVTVEDNEDEDSEKGDDIIKPDDNLVLLGRVEGEAMSTLEIYVHNENEGSFYCHHHIDLSSFPLCIEWLNFDPSDAKPGNLCAIGNMTSIIEIWDLDLDGSVEPTFKLGCKPSKKKNQKRVGHKDAVLALAWNTNYTHVLASGSADKTVLLWDLENATPTTKLENFNEKIQSIKWHPVETHELLIGSADKTAKLFDCRVYDTFKSWETTGEVENVLWNHFDPNYFFISTNNGNIECIDVRQSKHVWEVVAHEKEVVGLSLSSSCPGLLVTCSDDGVVKVWDAINPQILHPVFEKKMNLGTLLCLASNPDSPFVFVLGGDNKENNLKLWDLMEITAVSDHFRDRKLVQPATNENKNTTKAMESDGEMIVETDQMESMTLECSSSNKKESTKKKNSK